MGEFSSITRTGKHEPFNLHVQRGYVQGHNTVHKFGFATSVTASEVPIWNGGAAYVYPVSAGLVTLAAVSGTNATSNIKIVGLDANYNEIEEEVTLNATTTVTTSSTFIRVYRAYVSNDVNLGEQVDFYLDGNRTAVIDADENQTLMSLYTVPAGYTAYMYQLHISSGTANPNGYIKVRLRAREPGGVFRVRAKYTLANAVMEEAYPFPLKFPEKTDIQVTGQSSSGVQEIAAMFDLLLIKNESA